MKERTLARDAMARAGVPMDLAEHVELRTAPAITGDAPRAVVAVGYVSKGRFVETAMVNTTTMDDALGILADQDRILPLLALGVRGMPSSVRPMVPDWIERTAIGARRDMKRAGRLASDAARGIFPPPADTPRNGNEPF